MADFDEVAGLLHVHKAAHEHGDNLKHIRDAAMARLKQINEEHAPKVEEQPKPEPEPKEDQGEEEGVETNGDGRRV